MFRTPVRSCVLAHKHASDLCDCVQLDCIATPVLGRASRAHVDGAVAQRVELCAQVRDVHGNVAVSLALLEEHRRGRWRNSIARRHSDSLSVRRVVEHIPRAVLNVRAVSVADVCPGEPTYGHSAKRSESDRHAAHARHLALVPSSRRSSLRQISALYSHVEPFDGSAVLRYLMHMIGLLLTSTRQASEPSAPRANLPRAPALDPTEPAGEAGRFAERPSIATFEKRDDEPTNCIAGELCAADDAAAP